MTVDLAVVAGLKVADGFRPTPSGAVATTGNDKINGRLTAGAVTVTGLPDQVQLSTNADAIDNAGPSAASPRAMTSSTPPSCRPARWIFSPAVGGFGNDTITGTKNKERQYVLQGGTGNDLILWNAGDGADTIDGGGDIDTVRYSGFSPRATHHHPSN